MRHPASKRLLYTLFVAQSLFSASQIAIFTLIAIMATQLTGTDNLAGMPSSVRTFTQALMAYPAAFLMGRFGRRLGLSLGYGVGALAGVIGVIAIVQGSFPLLLGSAVLLGMGRASSDLSRFAAGELFPEAERGRMIGRVIFAGTIGAIVGPALVAPSGTWAEALGLPADSGPWLAAFGLLTLAALITVLLLRPDPLIIARSITESEEAAQPEAPRGPARSIRQLLALPMVQLGIIAMLIGQTVMVVLMVLTPLYMDHLHHPRSAISAVISAHTLGMFGLSAVTGYLIDRYGRKRMILLGALILIASALIAPVAASDYSLGLSMFLLGLGWNFCYVGGSSLLADALKGEERARIQGINDALVAFVAGLGSLSAGPLFAAGGYLTVSIVGLILTVVLIILTYWLSRPRLAAASPDLSQAA
jgi:MFS family permease